MKNSSGHSSGNALFLILIAVALFAALGYAVTKSRSDNSTISREKMNLDVSRMLQYASYVRAGAQRMVLTGTHPDDLVLSTTPPAGDTVCTTGNDCLFAEEGGGLLAQPAPTAFGPGVTTYYVETGGLISVAGVGTDDPEIYLAVAPMSDEACAQINKTLGLGSSINTDSDFLDTVFDAYPGETAACFQGDGAKAFYMVLISQ